MRDGGWDACFTEMWDEEWSVEGLQPPFYGSCPCHASVRLTQSFRIESTPLLYLPETRQRDANRVVPWGRIGAENELAQLDVRH